MTAAILLEEINKTFGDHKAVRNLHLKIPESRIYGFLGPNGAGKTTTIRMIMSIIYPDSGSISILGNQRAEAVKDRIGYLPEEKGLYKKMKVLELVSYFGQLKGMNAGFARKQAQNLLEEFELGEWLDKKCDALSKGMGQKVQLAATLVHDPDIVILDEPFSGLDPINIELVRNMILTLKNRGKTVIFSTHIMEQAEQICDMLMLINKGEKLIDGTLDEIKAGFEPTIKIEYEGELAFLQSVPAVKRLNDMGRQAEISLLPEMSSQDLLKELLNHQVTIKQFTLTQPSLHEIFVRTVGAHRTEGPES